MSYTAEKPLLSVTLPVYNQWHYTQRCLESLLAHSKLASEIIVVDNQSTDETKDRIENLLTRFREKNWRAEWIRNETNRGFGKAHNQGFQAAQGQYVAFLNNDLWLPLHWDWTLIKRARELGADMIGPYCDLGPFDPIETPKRLARFVGRNRDKYRRSWVSECMLFKSESFEKIGGFDERFFMTCEDTDLRERMEIAGMNYYQTADCSVWHAYKGTRSKSDLPKDYEYEAIRIFSEKWGFDPRARDHTPLARLKRRWGYIKQGLGLF